MKVGFITILLSIVVNTFAQVDSKLFFEFQPSYFYAQHNPSSFDTQIDQFDNGNWYAALVHSEDVNKFVQLPYIVALNLNGNYNNIKWRAIYPIKRDIEAWLKSEDKSNIPLSFDEIDINSINDAWIFYSDTLNSLKLGRFIPDFRINEFKSVHLDFQNYTEGIQYTFEGTIAQYSFSAFSLNSWLSQNNPNGENELYLQENNKAINQKGRSYNESIRTLFYHSIHFNLNYFKIGFKETALIGGKVPGFAQISPFTFWHNNYGDGYTNTVTSINIHSTFFDKKLRLLAEFAMDDITAGSAENLEAAEQVLATQIGFKYTSRYTYKPYFSLFWINTHSKWGEHPLPLLRLSQRKTMSTNNRLQEDPYYTDTWVSDQPLGYFRGAGINDYRLKVGFHLSRNQTFELESSFLETRCLVAEDFFCLSKPGYGYYLSAEWLLKTNDKSSLPDLIIKPSWDSRDFRGFNLQILSHWKFLLLPF
jgi:hypothetical protein